MNFINYNSKSSYQNGCDIAKPIDYDFYRNYTYRSKYCKYKMKYLELKKQIGENICDGKKVVIAESPNLDILFDSFYGNPLLVIDKEEVQVPYIFWKKIVKMIIDCSYESVIFQYKNMGALTDAKLESLNLLNDKDFLEKKTYNLKYPEPREYNEKEIILKFIEDFYFVFTDDYEDRIMYILVEEPDVLNKEGVNNYEPISMLTVWNHNPNDNYDDCDYYLGNFCTTPEIRSKGCGKILFENVLQKLKGTISLDVDKEDPRHNIKSHDSLVKYYKKFGFEVAKEKKDITLMKKQQDGSALAAEKKEFNYYDPQLFLNVLEENNVIPQDQSKFIPLGGEGSVHTSFQEIEDLINKSIQKIISQINFDIPLILIIPMFSEQAGSSVTKSNFWFSLLYLKKLTELKINIRDVVLIAKDNQNNKYFENIKKNQEKKVNVILCDDGVYSGMQMNNHLNTILRNPCIADFIEHIYVLVPFCIPLKRFNIDNIEEFKQNIEIFEVKKKEFEEKYYLNWNTMMKKWAKENNLKLIEVFNSMTSKYKYPGKFTIIPGDSNFNLEKNHWFDHKIPDRHSFVQPYRGDLNSQFIAPYKITWKVNGTEISLDIKEKLIYVENPNKLFFTKNPTKEDLNVNIFGLNCIN